VPQFLAEQQKGLVLQAMSILSIAWRNLMNRKLQTALAVLIISLGIAMTLSVIMLTSGIRDGIAEASKPYGMLVGSKGSANQLVFNTIYLMDTPLANLPLSYVEQLRQDERVARIVPFGLGDHYRGYRIVGTTEAFFELRSPSADEPYFQLQEGRVFKEPFEAVIGQRAARATGLSIGDTFTSGHGVVEAIEEDHAHAAHPYTVVGILKATGAPADAGIFVPISSYWISHGQHGWEEKWGGLSQNGDHLDGLIRESDHAEAADQKLADDMEVVNGMQMSVHVAQGSTQESNHAEDGEQDHHNLGVSEGGRTEADDVSAANVQTQDSHDEAEAGVTALLVQPDSYMHLMQLYAQINNGQTAQAVFPGQVLARLFDMLGSGEQAWSYISALILGMTVLTILLFMYHSTLEKRRHMAIMRAIGAGRLRIFALVILEAAWVTALGAAAGAGLSYVLSSTAAWYIGQHSTLSVLLAFSWEHVGLIAIVWASGVAAAVLPAIIAYRTEIAANLQLN